MKQKTVSKTLGQRLKDYRVSRDWTVAKIARMVGRSPSAIRLIESGTNSPNERTLFRMKQTLPELFE